MKAREWPGTSDAPSESPLHCLAICASLDFHLLRACQDALPPILAVKIELGISDYRWLLI